MAMAAPTSPTPSRFPSAVATRRRAWCVAVSTTRAAMPRGRRSSGAEPPADPSRPPRRSARPASPGPDSSMRRSVSPGSICTVTRSPSSAASSRSAHSLSVTPSSWRSSSRPPARVSLVPGEAIEVLVEERQPALVLRHQREAGAVDDLGDAEPAGEALGELGLAGTERSHERDPVAGAGDRGERRRGLSFPARRAWLRSRRARQGRPGEGLHGSR